MVAITHTYIERHNSEMEYKKELVSIKQRDVRDRSDKKVVFFVFIFFNMNKFLFLLLPWWLRQ